MSDNICKFCGAFWNPHYGTTPQYQCGTLAFLPGAPDWEVRSVKCYEAERSALKGLVREMGAILKVTLPLTLTACDWAMRYDIESLHDEAMAVNAMFFTKMDNGIMDRPEVEAIMKDQP